MALVSEIEMISIKPCGYARTRRYFSLGQFFFFDVFEMELPTSEEQLP